MSYETSILDLRGAQSCSEQRAFYTQEKMRIAQLAEKLGPIAAECFKLHTDYDAAIAKLNAATAEQSACKSAHEAWSDQKSKHDAYLAEVKICRDLNDKYGRDLATLASAKRAYADKVLATQKANDAAVATYKAKYAEVARQNSIINQQNIGGASTAANALAFWKDAVLARQRYLAAIGGQSSALQMAFDATKAKWPSLNNLQFNFMTSRCGTSQRCMTQADKDYYYSRCAVIKGLGATSASLPAADICQTRMYYPTCPTTCPAAYAADPGAQPAPFVPKPLLPYPAEPTLIEVKPYAQFCAELQLQSPAKAMQGLGIAASDSSFCPPNPVQPTCRFPSPVADPGPKPSCDPAKALPSVPAQPTCVAPDVPALPPAPTCKPGMFEQVNPMWLILAAGGVGIYLYSRKK